MRKMGKDLSRRAKGGLLALAAVLIATAAYAAGFLTNGLPQVGVAIANYSEVASTGLLPVDTQLSGGQPPQSVAASAFQVAAVYGEASGNTATSTAGAATLNTRGGVITTESLTTAAAGTYSFVLTDSLILATNTTLQVAMYSKTNTAGAVQVTSITPAAGSATIVFTNVGTAAFNGTFQIIFHI